LESSGRRFESVYTSLGRQQILSGGGWTYRHDHSYPQMVDFRPGTRMSKHLAPRDRPLRCAPFLQPFQEVGNREYHIASYACHWGRATTVSCWMTRISIRLTTLHPKSPIFNSPLRPAQSAFLSKCVFTHQSRYSPA